MRLSLKGTITPEQQKTFKISEIVKNTKDSFFHLNLDSQIEIEGFGMIFLGKINSPMQAFENHIESQLEKSTDPAEQEFLKQTKQLGMKYLGVQDDNQ